MKGLTSVGKYVPKLTRGIYKKRGFFFCDIVKDWPFIVGQQWAEMTCPEKLVFQYNSQQHGVLHLRVYGAAAVLIQHLQSDIIDRANSYFGYSAIAKIKILQAGVVPVVKTVREEYQGQVPDLDSWEDGGELKQALEALGRQILGKQS